MKYYNKIKTEIIDIETYKKVKDYSKNKRELEGYYKIGKLLIEAEGGETRAKYGDGLIKEYSNKLTEELGKGYDTTTLKRMRQFYIIIEKGAPLEHLLTWSHYKILLPLKEINKIKYYINECQKNNLSKRQLQTKIKNKEYERLDNKTKEKLINKEEQKIEDYIKKITQNDKHILLIIFL